jgi:predicted nucleotidyltransferase
MTSLSPDVEQNIASFVSAAQSAFGADLVSAILYGSAASGQMRATSDVNMVLILKQFAPEAANAIREPMRLAHAALQMKVMFLLESELDAATTAFAVKFADMAERHRVLFGPDPFTSLTPSRAALIHRLKQILLNLQLHLRERYVLVSLRPEKLVPVIADSASPLRASAASILQLRGQAHLPAKQALEALVQESGEAGLQAALQQMSHARENASLPEGQALPTLLALIKITEYLRHCALQLD